MQTNYKRPFAQYVKKARKPLQLAIEDAVQLICNTPDIGELKVGDLAEIHVYKFRFNRQEYLVAYRFQIKNSALEFLAIDFYQVGTHENFYTDLKRYLKQERGKQNESGFNC
jgi:mRNA-degrading endonuclease RelE of RelBE toxin-antitoxin system